MNLIASEHRVLSLPIDTIVSILPIKNGVMYFLAEVHFGFQPINKNERLGRDSQVQTAHGETIPVYELYTCLVPL